MAKLVFLGGIAFALIGVFLAVAYIEPSESAIPPTDAIDRISTSNGTVFSTNYSSPVNFIGTGDATVTGSNNSKTVYINVVGGGVTTMESLTNVTDIGCAVNEIRKVNASGWYVCSTDATGAGASDIISEGNSNVEVIDLGDGQVDVDIDGANEFIFDTDLLNVTGATIDNVGSLISNSPNPAFAGIILLADGDAISWRNIANNNDNAMGFSADIFDIFINGANELSLDNNALTLLGNSLRDVLFLESNAADPADTGAGRFGNAEEFCLEASPTGTDNCFTFDSVNDFLIKPSGTIEGNFSQDGLQLGTDDVLILDSMAVPSNPSTGKVKLFIDSTNSDHVSARRGSTTVDLEASGGGTAREELVADWVFDATMTNIGTTYNTVYDIANSNNEGIRIDTNGMSTATLQIHWTKVGTGTQKCQIRVAGGTDVLIVFNNLVSGLNLNATQDIPTVLENTINTYLPECKSTTAADDPIWLHGQILLR